MRAIRLIVLLVSVGSIARAQTTAPSTTQVDLEAARSRIALEVQLASLPRREVKSIEEVVRFEMRGQRLLARTPIDDLECESRILVPGVSGPITLRLGAAGGDDEPRDFYFTHHDVSVTGAGQTLTTVAMTSGKLTLARDHESESVLLSVQLLADIPFPNPDPDTLPVTLYVSRLNKLTNDREVDLRHSAASFRDLRLRWPEEVDEYLRPVFRDFRQEAQMLAPDPRVAWQVLSRDWQPDPQLADRVAALLTKLNADSFQEREAALSEMQQLGQPAALVLMRADRAQLSPEQRSNVDVVLAAYRLLAPTEIELLRSDQTFLLDVLTLDDAGLRRLAWARIRSLTKTDAPFDPDADPATRQQQLAALRRAISGHD